MLYAAGVAITTPGIVRLVQAAPSDSGNWITYLLNGGPFAVVLLLIVLDKIGTHAERDRLRSENNDLRGKNQELNDVLRNEVVPPLTELNRLMAETLRVLDDHDRFPGPPPLKRTRGV